MYNFEDSEPAPKIYKPVNLKALHKKELYRLKEKYKVKPDKSDSNEEVLLPEGYEDKAQIRRETVGSTHDAVKTEQANLQTYYCFKINTTVIKYILINY